VNHSNPNSQLFPGPIALANAAFRSDVTIHCSFEDDDDGVAGDESVGAYDVVEEEFVADRVDHDDTGTLRPDDDEVSVSDGEVAIIVELFIAIVAAAVVVAALASDNDDADAE